MSRTIAASPAALARAYDSKQSALPARRTPFLCPTAFRSQHRCRGSNASRALKMEVNAIFSSPTLFGEETEEEAETFPATWLGMPIGVDLGECPKGMNRYQTTFMMTPEAEPAALAAEIETILDCLKEAGAIATHAYNEGVEPLAYEISGNIDAYYVYINFIGPPRCASYLQEVQCRPSLEDDKVVLRWTTEKFPKNYGGIFNVWLGGTPPTPANLKKSPDDYEYLPWQVDDVDEFDEWENDN